ncbi:ATP-binding protein [Nocardia sp. CDC159]|uniref:ATP-binding protein n=1 Tax=Nocardia pulmonis TaxID=2951408 RepID=A0A9X2EGL6_9NOCA|nr:MULTISPECIES: ATP-binding protein [Nocardia]MCM6777961.1 ATP-binding protein [Nocardia pulmonis]MCM6790868.1 ATP-binding protein [Nocardia sp. CDC159]
MSDVTAEHEIKWSVHRLRGCSVVRPVGELDATTYRGFGDDLVKFTLDLPRAVIVVADELVVRAEPLLTAFANAWMRGNDWPGVPILLVVQDSGNRRVFECSAIRRFVPVYASVIAALRGAEEPPLRRRMSITLVRTGNCAQRARRFVDEVCEEWKIVQVRSDAELVTTEFVENSLRHNRVGTDLSVRLELHQDLLTVAVGDDDPREAVLREPLPGDTRLYGLHVVARMARAWGCAPRWPVGKVVWAALPIGPRCQLG